MYSRIFHYRHHWMLECCGLRARPSPVLAFSVRSRAVNPIEKGQQWRRDGTIHPSRDNWLASDNLLHLHRGETSAQRVPARSHCSLSEQIREAPGPGTAMPTDGQPVYLHVLTQLFLNGRLNSDRMQLALRAWYVYWSQ